jgi:hypothetical protein
MGLKGTRSHHRPQRRTLGARVAAWVAAIETRGVFVPGEENRSGSLWREYGWLIALWLIGVALYILFFAAAT